jgi:hypothetical protein
VIDHILESVISRGDLADLALLIWALMASFGALTLLRELSASNKRFDVFVRELHRFNSNLSDDDK